MKVGIIGGGLSGLVTAHALAKEHDIVLFETMPYLGGCLSSYHIDEYWIERYYHHCFSDDQALFTLLHELGLDEKLEWRQGSTGYYSGDTLYPLTTPVQILRWPELPLIDKAKLALLTRQAKKIDPHALDDITAETYILEHLGPRIYASFFEPLLRSKFGKNRSKVSAAWLISRIAIRSNRGVSGERLGYINGGFHQIIDRLETSILNRGGTIMLQTPVTSISGKNRQWRVNDERIDAIVSTIPPQELEKLSGLAMPDIPYQGAACMTLGIERDVCKGVYWTNMKDEGPYGAVVAHTNFIPKERYGEHIVYLASYFSGTVPPRLDQKMKEDFCSRFGLAEQEIHWSRMTVDPWAGPVYTTGYRSLIPTYERHGIYLAGMFSDENYPERSMEGSIRAGNRIAACIQREDSNGCT
ncbi:NAD(P)/FAD-dependent oxidoreductase [Methanoregula sp.]|uniref:NAD(P)/FAD-dependent oxidoreductase n=1 Tax=Methanoregula sp. TaxID=2052170 RepID=UPI002C5A99A4|nr:NAD(P)/FAD-dependent oxidoreductase [Methanoregula sp.]HVP96662.1 NAD(P)/FAD-dependent oxidoreductase [Methanoregula sp.]